MLAAATLSPQPHQEQWWVPRKEEVLLREDRATTTQELTEKLL